MPEMMFYRLIRASGSTRPDSRKLNLALRNWYAAARECSQFYLPNVKATCCRRLGGLYNVRDVGLLRTPVVLDAAH